MLRTCLACSSRRVGAAAGSVIAGPRREGVRSDGRFRPAAVRNATIPASSQEVTPCHLEEGGRDARYHRPFFGRADFAPLARVGQGRRRGPEIVVDGGGPPEGGSVASRPRGESSSAIESSGAHRCWRLLRGVPSAGHRSGRRNRPSCDLMPWGSPVLPVMGRHDGSAWRAVRGRPDMPGRGSGHTLKPDPGSGEEALRGVPRPTQGSSQREDPEVVETAGGERRTNEPLPWLQETLRSGQTAGEEERRRRRRCVSSSHGKLWRAPRS